LKRALVGWDGDDPVLSVEEPRATEISGFGMTTAEIWKTDSTPPDLHAAAAADAVPWRLEPPRAGTVFRIVTFAPGATTGTHATQTLDYLVVIDGSISLLVGDDDVRLESGDVVVLNGARHDWVNRFDVPCVMAAILVSAEP
jgi:quercetin dioxygenase-like cupin family protein